MFFGCFGTAAEETQLRQEEAWGEAKCPEQAEEEQRVLEATAK